jgi:hypothetical protein
MLDNLRDQAVFTDEEPLEPEPPKPTRKRRRRSGFDQMTGTTAPQRFFLAVLLAVVVCLVGVAFLFLTGKIVLPF